MCRLGSLSMSAEAPAFTTSWPVGRYVATLTMPRTTAGAVASAVIEWQPAVPSGLTRAELKQYREGRDAALQEVARVLGLRIGVIEA